MLRSALAALALTFAGALPASAEGVGLYIWALGEQAVPAGASITDAPLTAELAVRNSTSTARALERYSTLDLLETRDDAILVLSRTTDTIRLAPTAADSKASFVIDYDEPSVAELVDQLATRAGRTPSPEELRRFVYDHISDKSYARDSDLASRIAISAAGDCTEHATLLTAMARANGYPSRVVFGVMMVGIGDKINAFGHAWSEIHDGARWQIADATLPTEEGGADWTRYLPVMPMVNEGPGFAMGLMELNNVWPTGVRVKGLEEDGATARERSDS